jgi:hypothetical protein
MVLKQKLHFYNGDKGAKQPTIPNSQLPTPNPQPLTFLLLVNLRSFQHVVGND